MTAEALPQPERNPWGVFDTTSRLPLDTSAEEHAGNVELSGLGLETTTAEPATTDAVVVQLPLGELADERRHRPQHAATPEGLTALERGKTLGRVALANLIHPSRWLPTAKRAGQVAVAATVLSPANEAIRLSAMGAGYVASHSPAMGALTAGGSTAVLELAGAYAAAGLLGTETGGRFSEALGRKMKKVLPEKLSPVTKATTTLGLGTVVGMAIEQAEDPTRTVQQNRRYGLITSAWLGGATAVGGAAGAETVNAAMEKPQVVLPVLGGVVLLEGARRLVHKLRRPQPEQQAVPVWRDSDEFCSYRLVDGGAELEGAAQIEQQVWDEKNYGNLVEEGYTDYIRRSRTFAAFDKDGNCVGVNRMFGGTDGVLPPFLGMPFDDQEVQAELTRVAKEGALEELGTVALLPEYRGKNANMCLWRLAYRDAVYRGVKQWGIIMEPRRVRLMNKRYGFTFKQLGPAKDYQGGDCAAFVADLDELIENVRQTKPDEYEWLVNEPLNA